MRLFNDELLIDCTFEPTDELKVNIKAECWFIEWPTQLATEALCELIYN